MRMKRRAWLTGGCLLVAALGTQPALSQEQPKSASAETQTVEEMRLSRAYAACLQGRGSQMC